MSFNPSTGNLLLKMDGAITPPPPPPPGDGGTQTLKTMTVFFWGTSSKNEPFYEPPARRTRQLVFRNLVSATMRFDVWLGNPGTLDNAILNGATIAIGGEVANGIIDVTDIVRNGANTLELNYSLFFGLPGLAAGLATVSVDLAMNLTDAEFEDLIKRNETANDGVPMDWKTIAMIAGIGVAAVGGLVLIASLRPSAIERSVAAITNLELMKSLRRKK